MQLQSLVKFPDQFFDPLSTLLYEKQTLLHSFSQKGHVWPAFYHLFTFLCCKYSAGRLIHLFSVRTDRFEERHKRGRKDTS